MTRISALDVVDVRFPTSRGLDGSDAMNPEPDYSAAYLVLRTDDPDVSGCSLLFTTGRGNDVACAAIRALAPYVVGRDVGRARRRHRRACPGADLGRPAPLARPGEGRHAHGDRRRRERGLGPAGAPRGQPLWRVLATLVARGDRRARSTSPTSTTPHARRRARDPPSLRATAGRAHGSRCSRPTGFPPTRPRRAGSATTTKRWPGWSRESIADGFTMLKLKVGADIESDIRRLGVARVAVGEAGAHRPRRQPALGRRQAIEWMARLAAFDPYWIEEPTSPDDVLGHRTIRDAVRPIRVATGEHVQNRVIFKQLLQAEAIDVVQIDACRVGGVNENLAILLLAAKFGVPVCPHAGGVGLCEMVQHLAMFDFVAVSGTIEGRWIEYVDHLHEHFTAPVRRRGRPLPGAHRRRRRGPAPRRVRSPSSGSPTARRGRDVLRDGSRVDAHHHLWDLAVRDQPWIDAGGHGPDPSASFGHRATSARSRRQRGIDRTVVVQTVADVAETEELLDWPRPTPLDQRRRRLRRPHRARRGRATRPAPRRGRRRAARRHPQPRAGRARSPTGWLRADVIAGLRAVAAARPRLRPADPPHQLDAAVEAAAQVPEGRFVVDHLAKPAIASGGWEPWASASPRWPRARTCRAKLSGLVTEADWRAWSVDDLRPYADHVLTAFGPDRLLFGSDWPVCLLAGSYVEVVERGGTADRGVVRGRT